MAVAGQHRDVEADRPIDRAHRFEVVVPGVVLGVGLVGAHRRDVSAADAAGWPNPVPRRVGVNVDDHAVLLTGYRWNTRCSLQKDRRGSPRRHKERRERRDYKTTMPILKQFAARALRLAFPLPWERGLAARWPLEFTPRSFPVPPHTEFSAFPPCLRGERPGSYSKKSRSSSERRFFASLTMKSTPRPGRSQTAMWLSLTIGSGRPSTMSYHHSGRPTGYSKAM